MPQSDKQFNWDSLFNITIVANTTIHFNTFLLIQYRYANALVFVYTALIYRYQTLYTTILFVDLLSIHFNFIVFYIYVLDYSTLLAKNSSSKIGISSTVSFSLSIYIVLFIIWTYEASNL